MSEEPQYENELFQQLNNLPFPDEDSAWEDMQKLLDDERNKRLPYAALRRFVLWSAALLAVLMVTAVLWLNHSGKKIDEKELQVNSRDAKNKQNGSITGNPANKDVAKLARKDSNEIKDLENKADLLAENKPGATGNKEALNAKKPLAGKVAASKEKLSKVSFGKLKSAQNGAIDIKNISIQKPGVEVLLSKGVSENPAGGKNIVVNPGAKTEPVTARPGETGKPLADIIAKEQPKTARIDQPAQHNEKAAAPLTNNLTFDYNTGNPGIANSKKFHIAIGLSVQHPVRLDCNCGDPDANHRDMPEFKDYIPSIYVRVYPAKKWFIQAEYKHDALEYTQELLYKTYVQNLPLNYITTSYTLKKIYYNQVPVSFNYFISPNWSAGIGIIYNSFSDGVIQRDVKKKLYGTAEDSLINTKIITGKNDSNFVNITKNSFQGFIESEYRWKRFSFGARYAVGLQPFIRYDSPATRKMIEEKNNALNFFIRFELWDSFKKKK